MTNASAGLRWLNRSDPNLAEVRTNLEQIVRAGHRIDEIIASTRAMFGKETSEKRRWMFARSLAKSLPWFRQNWKPVEYRYETT